MARTKTKVTKKKVERYESALVLNDMHFPFEDKDAIELAMSVGDALSPDIIFLNGDVADCWQISHYVKNPKLQSVANLKNEITSVRNFLTALRWRFKCARIIYIFGNHEYRWQVYLSTHALDLVGMTGMTLEEQLGTEALNIEVVNTGRKENSYLWGKLLVGHFDKVSSAGGMTAKALVEQKAISLIQAHTHRGGSSFRRLYDRFVVGYENFCLCELNPDYVDRPNWQLGFSTVVNDGNRFHVTQHPIIIDQDGVYRTWFEGQEYLQF